MNTFMYKRHWIYEYVDVNPTHGRVRSAVMLKVVRPKNDIIKRSVLYHGAMTWNIFPAVIMAIDTLLVYCT